MNIYQLLFNNNKANLFEYEIISAQSLITYAGERFDFIVEMNQEVGNYWMHFRGLLDCGEAFTKAYQVAVLRYEGASRRRPMSHISWESRVLNNVTVKKFS